ncbi:FAD-dependent oxidoreductase [Seleniivibrio sp.]|uniref:FAD-dependent oxidoreductase n=1 Tax=Seleniivibrio sp. TaxID=2898801 RepID=UPI0025DE32F1|nr:FAD-dependent oxidoreductase [Seleniivibrio sp.]MCD8554770.1 FAD-dependent oxidoreductase [Seleniivibrio sp.]
MGKIKTFLMSFVLLMVSSLCFAATGTVQQSYDVVVIGGGASGAAAALSAAQSGSKVLLIEKARELGASQFSSGMMGVNTSLQRARNMKITPLEVFKQMEDYTHLFFNARLARTTVEHSAETIDWLMKNGAKIWLPDMPQQFAHDAEKPIIYHRWNSNQGVKAIGASFEKAGGTVLLRTTGSKILTDANGAVCGVEAVGDDGTKYSFKTKVAIVATGGFLGNQKMMDDMGIVGHPMGWLYNDGDGLKMAWDAGAAKYHETVTEYHGTGIVEKGTNKESVFMPKLESLIHVPILWLDKTGQRYYNEHHVYDNAYVANALVPVGGSGFVVFDQAMLNKFMTSKTGMIDSFANIRNIPGLENGPIPNLQKDLEAAMKEGIVFKGNTLEELAAKAGFHKDDFVKQVADYNRYVKTGVDEQFGKPKADLLYPVSKSPFYALEVTAYNLTTIGGIRVNEKLEAVDNDMNPVKGLYAVGNVAGGLYSDSYMTVEGLTAGFAVVSGKLAGENSSAYVKSLKK